MSRNARDLIELLRDYARSHSAAMHDTLQRLALNLIAPGVLSERGGC